MAEDQHGDISNNEIVRAILSSVTSLEIMSLFNRNPNLIDTVEGVAKRLGLGADKVKSDLEELVSIGLLRKKTTGNSIVFLLDKDKMRAADTQIQAALGKMEVFNSKTREEVGEKK